MPIDYQKTLSQLAKEQKYDRVYLITDHPTLGQADILKVITVGQAKDNLCHYFFQYLAFILGWLSPGSDRRSRQLLG